MAIKLFDKIEKQFPFEALQISNYLENMMGIHDVYSCYASTGPLPTYKMQRDKPY